MPVKMGTGVRYYPDYCIYANPVYGEETARFILETKYRISNTKQLESAFYQARSYAVRLQSRIFAIAAQEGLWIFMKTKETLTLSNKQFYTWKALVDQDTFHSVAKLIGQKSISKRH